MHDRGDDIETDVTEKSVAAAPERRQRVKIEILHQDANIVIFSKPAGVWPDESPTEVDSVLEQLEGLGLLGAQTFGDLTYHLDPDVSGVMLFARNEATSKNLERQSTANALDLALLALVQGPVSGNDGTINLRLSPRSLDGRLPMRIDLSKGREADTQWKVQDRFIGYALLECRTQPLIPNQVRAHLLAIGMPLVVDPLYGGAKGLMLSTFKAGYRPSRRHGERPLIDRVSMHAAAVSFVHPTSGETMRFTVLPPKDFRAALHQLDRFGRMPR